MASDGKKGGAKRGEAMNKLKETILRWVVQVATFLGVPSDKLLHFLCAFACMISVSMLTNECIGIIITIALSIWKEIYDRNGNGAAEIGDLFADMAGIAIGWLIVFLV